MFIGLIYLAVISHSERWLSFAKGFLFFTDWTDEQQVELIGKICLFTVPILSVPFLVFRSRVANIALITLMIILILLVFPFGYVKDPTISF